VIDPIWLKAYLKPLLLPPTGLLLLAVIGLAIRRRFPRVGIALAWTGVLVLLALSMPVVSAILLRSLDSSPPIDIERASAAQAIVILGGGTRRNAPEYGGDTLGQLTLERVRYGARVARLTHLPILVSGGSVLGGEPEAKLMQQSLQSEFGVEVRWIEDHSRNTHENALRSSEILRAAGISRVVLVAHSFDMPRATAEFAAAGITCIPAPTGIQSGGPFATMDFVPSLGGLQGSYYALYEIAANVVRLISP
jgi:uncharacterized SAM-binding protein YcdF (DUF218 family)